MNTLITNEWKLLSGDVSEYERFAQMNDTDKRLYHFIDGHALPCISRYNIYRKGENIVVATQRRAYGFGNNRFYPKSQFETVLTITPKRVYCNSKAILTNLIFNIFKVPYSRIIRAFNAREIRAIFTGGEAKLHEILDQLNVSSVGIHLAHMKPFVDNFDLLCSRHQSGELNNREFYDLVEQAKALNRMIKASWSVRKIHDVHMKWTEEISKLKCRNASNTPIWNIDDIQIPIGVQLINSEMMCAQEGSNMHHCLYSNYSHSIKAKRYMAFHVNSRESDYTVGFRIVNNKCQFDQAFCAWNKHVSTSQKEFAKVALLELAQEICDKNNVSNQLPF